MYLHEVVKEGVPFKHSNMIGAYVCYGNYIYHCSSEQDCYNTIVLQSLGRAHTIYFPWMDQDKDWFLKQSDKITRESAARNDWFNVKKEG